MAKNINLGHIVGRDGVDGAPGRDGLDGAAATVEVGIVTTGEPGTQAAVTNGGTTAAAVLNFVIPRGAPGQDGADGADGAPGTNGKSAYQAAVDAGYTGTEAEFNAALLTLKSSPFLPLAGGTMTGNILFRSGVSLVGSGPGSQSKMTFDGSSVVFALTAGGEVQIGGVANPSSGKQATNKDYVDSAISTAITGAIEGAY